MNQNEFRLKLDNLIEIANQRPHYEPDSKWMQQWNEIKDIPPGDTAIKSRIAICASIAARLNRKKGRLKIFY